MIKINVPMMIVLHTEDVLINKSNVMIRTSVLKIHKRQNPDVFSNQFILIIPTNALKILAALNLVFNM